MLFNSFEYALFLPLVFCLYWTLFSKDIRARNIFLIIVSYIFYGFWSWKFLTLIAFSSTVDYFIGKTLHSTQDERGRKRLLYTSLFVNLGLLAVFKYFNFFSDSFAQFVGIFGWDVDQFTLNIILPVGISFYTFQTLSYTIDIYRKQLEPTTDIFAFFAFVSFFPQLVAGPIERAKNLLPQFFSERKFDYAKSVDGCRQILCGLFKKIVIADNAAVFVNDIFANYSEQPASILLIGTILFAFQVYGDFSGYSDIAIGTARLFGFDLMTNFKTPYFSKNYGEFWKRWHISLSSWIMDYVYNPLVIHWRNWKMNGILMALIVTFTINGFWHGASWNFVVFGFILGLFIAFEAKSKKWRKRIRKKTNSHLYAWISRFITFTTWCLVCILFRTQDLHHAASYYSGLWRHDFLPENLAVFYNYKIIFFLILFIMVLDWINRSEEHNLALHKVKNVFLRRSVYVSIFLMIMVFAGEQEDFIYFQF